MTKNQPRVLEEVTGKTCRLCEQGHTTVQRWTNGVLTVRCSRCDQTIAMQFSMSADGSRGYLEPLKQKKG